MLLSKGAVAAPENNEGYKAFLFSTEGQYHVNQDTYSESR